jgi:hypothetical protein
VGWWVSLAALGALMVVGFIWLIRRTRIRRSAPGSTAEGGKQSDVPPAPEEKAVAQEPTA